MEYGEEEAKWREGRRRKATGEELSEGKKKGKARTKREGSDREVRIQRFYRAKKKNEM